MSERPRIVLHLLPPSHPCATVEAALKLKGLEYKRVELQAGPHVEEMKRLYGEGRHTVPGAMFDDEPVHGSIAILERLEQLVPEPALYPADLGDAVARGRALGRRGASGSRPSLALGCAALPSRGSGHLRCPRQPAGRGWHRLCDALRPRVMEVPQHHRGRLAEDLAGLPAKLDRIDAYVAEGILAADQPNAADFQIGATLAVLLTIGDVRSLIEGRPAEQVARKWFDDRPGDVPAGAFPAGWVLSA